MRTPIITIFMVFVLVLALAVAFYDYKKHGAHEEPLNITKSESDILKEATRTGEEKAHEQNYESAIENFKKALRISPRDAYLHNNLGAAYYYLGLQSMDEPMEEDEFGFGVEVDGRYDKSKTGTLNKVKEALDKVNSGIITVVVNDEDLSKEIENYIISLDHYVHVEEEDKGDNSKEYWITIIKGKTKEAFLNAEEEYLTAIELRSVRDSSGRKYSNYSAASRNLGTLYFRVGRKKEALAQWQRALRLEPDAELRALIDKYEK